MSQPIHAIQTTPNALLAELQAAGATPHERKMFCCPFHDDHSPSASLYFRGGVYRFKCHACGASGDVFDLMAKREGVDVGEIIKRHSEQVTPPAPKTVKLFESPSRIEDWLLSKCQRVIRYDYEGDLVVFRTEPSLDGKKPKGFIQCSPQQGGWSLKLPEQGKLPIYNRARIKDAQRVVVVEGEKAADALIGVGICATTSSGGANNADRADWSPLVDKDVYLWADHDEPGMAHMDNIEGKIEKLAKEVFRVDPLSFDLNKKEDAYDFVQRMRRDELSDQNIRNTIANTLLDSPSSSPSDGVFAQIEQEIAGTWRDLGFADMPTLSSSTRAMLPGKVVVVCGDPGDGKTFFMYQNAAAWIAQGEKVALYELEDNKDYHLRRILAQLSLNSKIADDRWVYDNGDDAKEAYAMRRDALNKLGRAMWDSPDRELSLKDLGDWVEARCKENFRVLIIDPVTAAATGDKRFNEDLAFVNRVKALARNYNATVILITHPAKGVGKRVGLEYMAGGAAYGRFTHSVLWIQKHANPKTVAVPTSGLYPDQMLPEEVQINRTFVNLKVRDGPGNGLKIGFNFDPETLCFEEVGAILKECK